jgi:mannose-6-phosphate isomerase-like protein (cupin superfamily)
MATERKQATIIRNVSDIEQERGVCGFRRKLVTGADTPVAYVSHLVIDNSREHYHKIMTEYYYVIKGSGEIFLDGEAHAIKSGDIVVIPPLVRHTSKGDLEVLIFGAPALEAEDIYFD